MIFARNKGLAKQYFETCHYPQGGVWQKREVASHVTFEILWFYILACALLRCNSKHT